MGRSASACAAHDPQPGHLALIVKGGSCWKEGERLWGAPEKNNGDEEATSQNSSLSDTFKLHEAMRGIRTIVTAQSCSKANRSHLGQASAVSGGFV